MTFRKITFAILIHSQLVFGSSIDTLDLITLLSLCEKDFILHWQLKSWQIWALCRAAIHVRCLL